jgi:hypothetical protein
VVVIATANHFILDVAGGAACVIIAATAVAAWQRVLWRGRTPDHDTVADSLRDEQTSAAE